MCEYHKVNKKNESRFFFLFLFYHYASRTRERNQTNEEIGEMNAKRK